MSIPRLVTTFSFYIAGELLEHAQEQDIADVSWSEVIDEGIALSVVAIEETIGGRAIPGGRRRRQLEEGFGGFTTARLTEEPVDLTWCEPRTLVFREGLCELELLIVGAIDCDFGKRFSFDDESSSELLEVTSLSHSCELSESEQESIRLSAVT